ncbi:MAG: AAA family ATPase [Butyrivibrio sp.]|uniref:ExeA family protein n=1 Tax=Butyrivibrio sp. TaxID=28121 RepID=UPI001B1A3312|nr:AAA family ATPase [Butyrivibrio sp.]MBO6241882.1 AAA family ATPase [Butyrivibrio sp.]
MFEEFFGMKHTPFSNQIPAEALYLSDNLQEVIGRLCYVAEHQLFGVLTGMVGVGKSTIIRRLKSSLPADKYLVLYLSDSQLTPRWFYNGLLQQLGSEPKFQRGDAKLSLHRQLEYIREVRHIRVVTIVDEAHLLKRETLEEIRFLLNYHMDSMNPMALILVGQDELWDKLVKSAYAAIRQRIDIKCALPSYDLGQCQKYIATHMKYAGCEQEIFTEDAIKAIYEYSAGSARGINKVCMHSLLCAAQRGKKLIDDHLVHLVIESELP